MSEDFAGNSFDTGGNLNLTPSIHTFGDSGSPLDTREQYSLTPGGSSSFNLSLDEKSVNADVEQLNSTSEILPTSALLGINGQSLYKTGDATAPNQEATPPQNWDSLTAFGEPMFETGVFTVGLKGEVGVDFLLDGGKYQGELAIFSLKGIDQFELGSEDFIQEAARRALSDSQLGHVVINDLTEGARFHGSFAWEDDSNSGDYQGVKTFLMRPGDQFGVMLVPNGTVQQVFDNPAVDGATRPLFSLATANPNDAFHVGQIADVTGEGNTFVMEDLRVDGWIDKDYNDIIFQVRGATAKAVLLDEVIKPAYDWRGTDLGEALIAYAKPYVTSAEPVTSDPIVSDPIVSPPINSDVTSAKPIDAVPIVSPPLDTNPVVTPPVNSDITSAKPIDAVPIVSPPLETNPVVTAPVDSKSVTFDFPALNQPLVGVIDTGFSGNNPDIDYSRIILGRDRISNDDNPLLQPGEGNEHGTHVLGIIGATQNNGIGIDGVNDKAPIWLGRAVGSGQWAESLVEFVDAAKASGKPNAVINLSLDLTQVNPDGSVTTRYEFTPQERAAIEYARQNQVLIVVAAGNDGDVMSILGQASQEFDNIITVGAADGLDRAAYSSYGYGLDILARGGTMENLVLSTTGNDVGTMAGTSVAAAHVTGAVSQVWAANPQLSYRQVIDTVKLTATDLNLPGRDAATGAGLLNLAAAVFLAKMLVPEDNATPAIDIPSTWSASNTQPVSPLAIPSWQMSSSAKGTGSVAVGQNQDGRQEAFVIGSDNKIYHAWQTSLNGTWSNWQQLSGGIATSLTVGQNQDGRLQVFAIGTDNKVYQAWQTSPNGTWSNWQQLSGGIATSLTVGRNQDGRLQVFAIGTDNKVYQAWQTSPNGTWSNWQQLSGGIAKSITVDRNQDGRLEVFAIGTDNKVYHAWQTSANGTWSNWQQLSGGIAKSVTVGQNQDGRLQVFAISTDNKVYQAWQTSPNGTWSNWQQLSGGIAKSITVGQNQDGRLEVFAIGTDNKVYHAWQTSANGTWSNWQQLSGGIATSLTVGQNQDGRLEVLATGTDNKLYQAWQTSPNGTWSNWSDRNISVIQESSSEPPGGSYFNSLAPWTDWQWEDTINSAADLTYINNNPNTDIGKLYRDLSNDLFGRYFPMTGAFISDDYYNATGGDYGYHGGIDIGADLGTPVKSLVEGRVVIADLNNSGIVSIQDRQGRYHIYMHLDEIHLSVDNQVTKGTVIGKTGQRGQNNRFAFAPHLHYEVSRNLWGALQNPAAQTKQQFRERSYNPLKIYWEMRRNG